MNKIFSEAILQPEFPLDGVHLVAASAGTGKTYNIQNVYARLIMEKGRRVSEILVVTFTEAATKELRDRLRTILKELQARYAGRNCEGKDETDITNRNAHADALIKCAAGEPKARARVELALLEFDNAAISTIHGFCLRALKKFNELPAANDIDSAGNRVGPGDDGLLLELGNPVLLVHAHRAVALHIHVRGHVLHDHGNVCLALDVVFQHLVVIHLVDAVAGGDHHIRLMRILEEIEVLCDGIRRTPVPAVALLGNGGGEEEEASLLAPEIPPLGGA